MPRLPKKKLGSFRSHGARWVRPDSLLRSLNLMVRRKVGSYDHVGGGWLAENNQLYGLQDDDRRQITIILKERSRGTVRPARKLI